MSGKNEIAEYYFDYTMQRISGTEQTVKEPKVYFERDYGKQDLSYSMFAVPEEWLGRQDVENKISDNPSAVDIASNLEQLPYDKVYVVFDINGTDCGALTHQGGEAYKNAEIKNKTTFLQFCKAQCRVFIERQNAKERSGVGIIEMRKTVNGKEKVVASFFFAVNFCFRKKIWYDLRVDGRNLNMVFSCPQRPSGLKVDISYAAGRLPCLKSDTRVNALGEAFELDFSKSAEFRKTITLDQDTADRENRFFAFFPNERDEKYYLLDCNENSSIPAEKPREFISMTSDTCPFCHQKFDEKVSGSFAYRSGGAVCSGTRSKNVKYPIIYADQKTLQSKCVYCAEDFNVRDGKASFKNAFMRLLPDAFLDHDTYKIAFSGSTRAGKTTYLSRFFGITGDNKINMPMTMVSHSLSRMGISVKSAPIPLVKAKNAIPEYQVEEHGWADETAMYVERSVNLNPPHFPMATPGGDYTSYPFVAEVMGKKKSYISFYDIAGEDAEHETQVRRVAGGGLIGVFCFINGISDAKKHRDVIVKLLEAGLDPNCPIAMIVTKMDAFKDEFDSNCHCLRTDYFHPTKEYFGSDLEHEINFASEEIRSYLHNAGLLSDMSNSFNNIKYFSVSAFNFKDSIHKEGELDNTEGHLYFDCSSKRLELPFIWMLNQFGIIK